MLSNVHSPAQGKPKETGRTFVKLSAIATIHSESISLQRPDYNSPKVSRHTTVATSRASFEVHLLKWELCRHSIMSTRTNTHTHTHTHTHAQSGFGSLQSPHNSVTSDPDSDMGEQTMTSQDVDLEGSIVALPLNFDSEEVHDIDRKQVREILNKITPFPLSDVNICVSAQLL